MKGFKNSTKTHYYTGGPVKTGDKRDSEYGDYVIAAKKSAERKKGEPMKKDAPMKKAEGGKVDLKQDKALVKTAVHKHERNMHPGKTPTQLRKGGKVVGYMCGGKVRS